MKELTIARRYSNALFKIAKEKNSLSIIMKELETFVNFWNSQNEITLLLNSPLISINDKKKVFDKVINLLKINSVLKNMLYIMLERRKLSIIPHVYDFIKNKSEQDMGIYNIEIFSIHQMEEAYISKIKMILSKKTGKNIVIKNTIQQDLIEGIVIKIGNKYFDGSLKRRLERLREHLLYQTQ